MVFFPELGPQDGEEEPTVEEQTFSDDPDAHTDEPQIKDWQTSGELF
jgi:hypothetical protein